MPFDDTTRCALLDCARAAIAAELGDGPPPDTAALVRAGIGARLGAFVTVRRGEVLRGCRGILETGDPLPETVAQLACLSAFADPRFPPFTREELPDLHLDISVLHARRRIEGPEEIELGTDGLLLTARGYRGFLLPQVADEHGLDAEGFLDALCNKAGLPPGAWHWPDAVVEAFAVEHFDDG